MEIDINQIEFSEADRRLLAEIAEATGKPWNEVLTAALTGFRQHAALQTAPNGRPTESVYDRLEASGLLGCLPGGPTDLSTNPAYMEGFGEDGR
jgi:hypothetical protein